MAGPTPIEKLVTELHKIATRAIVKFQRYVILGITVSMILGIRDNSGPHQQDLGSTQRHLK